LGCDVECDATEILGPPRIAQIEIASFVVRPQRLASLVAPGVAQVDRELIPAWSRMNGAFILLRLIVLSRDADL